MFIESNLSHCTLCIKVLHLITLSSTCCRVRGAKRVGKNIKKGQFLGEEKMAAE